jgi:predicted phage terminase large subunit-like protein
MDSHQKIIQGLNRSLNRYKCLEKLSFFVKHFWDEIVPNDLVWNWHMDVLCDAIQESDERVFKRLPKLYDTIMNVPPGTSKTKIVSVLSTAWEFARMPEIKVFVGSYSDAAISSIADEIRLIMKSEKYQSYFQNVHIRRDRDTLHNFKTTSNGEFYAFTVGGTLTSKHADILKVDDPINPKQAASVAELKTANDFFDKTLPTRKVDKLVTPTNLIMQRLAVNDPTGHLLEKKKEGIRHICLPAKLSKNVKPAILADEYIKHGGYLDPVRLSQPILDDLKLDLGSAGYAGQIDQLPAPEGGTIWQKWFIEVPDDMFPDIEKAHEVGADWDLAYTKQDKNAASAFIKSGVMAGNIYIFDFNWQWLEFPELIKWMKDIGGPHYIEAKASGKSARQVLKRNGIVAIEVKVNSDKISRAKDATPPAEAGMVYVKKSMADRLYNDSKQGILFFPNGQYADLADTLSQMLVRRSKKGKIVSSGSPTRENGQDQMDWIKWTSEE